MFYMNNVYKFYFRPLSLGFVYIWQNLQKGKQIPFWRSIFFETKYFLQFFFGLLQEGVSKKTFCPYMIDNRFIRDRGYVLIPSFSRP